MIMREAIAADAPAIEDLYRRLVPEDRNIAVTPTRIAQIAADLHNFLFVAEDDGTVVATAFLTFCLDPMYDALPYAVLENLVVAPDRRDAGCGRLLMRHIEHLCWQRRCTKIMLFSSAFRRAAHGFFSGLGFARDKKVAFVKYRNTDYEAAGPR